MFSLVLKKNLGLLSCFNTLADNLSLHPGQRTINICGVLERGSWDLFLTHFLLFALWLSKKTPTLALVLFPEESRFLILSNLLC